MIIKTIEMEIKEIKELMKEYWCIKNIKEDERNIIVEIDDYIMRDCVTNKISFCKDNKHFMYTTLHQMFSQIKEFHVNIKNQ